MRPSENLGARVHDGVVHEFVARPSRSLLRTCVGASGVLALLWWCCRTEGANQTVERVGQALDAHMCLTSAMPCRSCNAGARARGGGGGGQTLVDHAQRQRPKLQGAWQQANPQREWSAKREQKNGFARRSKPPSSDLEATGQ